jgi:hypothetical protein
MTVRRQPSVDGAPRHPLGSEARVLLTSVFGPYAQDDAYGSRRQNPMELYHNQVTREQGPFSLRMFHRSWGLMLLQANIEAPCTLLDFPTRERFIAELQQHRYDIVGIGAIMPNLGKVQEMCRLIRQYQPEATILIGGHIANVPDLAERVDADHIVRGEGVAWLRGYLGEDRDRPIRHPLIQSGFGRRSLGITVPHRDGDIAATLIPSVGCPMGCNFCSTSAMFGGKGRYINFYETGDELFEVMCGLEEALQTQAFFVMDENFLLHRKRALRLLELMREHGKAWSLYVFSSANALSLYSMDDLVGLGISWVWIGLEGEESAYTKLKGTDSRSLVKRLQAHGIRVLGSTIIGLEEHSPETIGPAIEFAVSHDTEFHQFMLYTPIPGTPLYHELTAKGEMLSTDEVPFADRHGQLRFVHRHPRIPAGEESAMLRSAFVRDFEVNGPSVLRILRSTLQGWRRFKDHPEARVRERFRRECADLSVTFAGALWAARRYFRRNPGVAGRLAALLNEFYGEHGWKERLAAPLLGRVLYRLIRKEEARLAAGWTYEPPTFYDRNAATGAGQPIRWIEPARREPVVSGRAAALTGVPSVESNASP